MPKKKIKVIKRVYERGKETTLPFIKRQRAAARQRLERAFKPAKSLISKRTVAGKKLIRQPRPAVSKEPRPVFIDSYELPPNYGTTRLRLMVKDPFWIFAYWEIAQSSLRALSNMVAQATIESGKIILRMYEVSLIDFNGSNANHYFDIEVGPHLDNWYIKLWEDNVSYIGEIGLRAASGEFYPLARSNTVHTPRASYSGRSEQIWMEVKDDGAACTYLLPQLQPKRAAAQAKKAPSPLALKRKGDIYYLSEEDIRGYYSKLSLFLREIVGSKLSKFWSDKGRKGYFLLEGETAQERELILSRLPRDYFIKRLITGSSESLLVVGASEQRLEGPGGASDFLHEKLKRKFFFELSTELIVYGRTELDAQVWLKDQRIQLRPDGTFSLRLALGDGKIPLEFTALSADRKEKRKIDIHVQRSTNYLD